jgi:hypothetical protein
MTKEEVMEALSMPERTNKRLKELRALAKEAEDRADFGVEDLLTWQLSKRVDFVCAIAVDTQQRKVLANVHDMVRRGLSFWQRGRFSRWYIERGYDQVMMMLVEAVDDIVREEKEALRTARSRDEVHGVMMRVGRGIALATREGLAPGMLISVRAMIRTGGL